MVMWSIENLIIREGLAALLDLVESTGKGTVILEGALTGLTGEGIDMDEEIEGIARILFGCVNRIGSDSDLDSNGHCGVGSEVEKT